MLQPLDTTHWSHITSIASRIIFVEKSWNRWWRIEVGDKVTMETFSNPKKLHKYLKENNLKISPNQYRKRLIKEI